MPFGDVGWRGPPRRSTRDSAAGLVLYFLFLSLFIGKLLPSLSVQRQALI